jgi:iron complex transport system permease protein
VKAVSARRVALVVAGGAAVLAAALLVGLAAGPSSLAPAQALAELWEADPSGPAADIVWRVRLPRVLLGALVGAALASSGVLFQSLLRNPLADPFVLGVSGGAALGATLVLALARPLGLAYGAVPPAAFAGAVGATALLYALAGGRARFSPTELLLTGVVFNAFASAGIVFLASLSGLSEGTSIFLWLIGSLASARPEVTAWVAALLALGLACALALARSLNLLALGAESAQQLGVEVERDQRVVLLATSLMVGAAVAAAGLVGFVGLVIPHLLRLVVGPDHRVLVPAAALGGGAFLVLCDTLARSLLGGRELPVGALTALAGGPLFLWLLRRHARGAGP